ELLQPIVPVLDHLLFAHHAMKYNLHRHRNIYRLKNSRVANSHAGLGSDASEIIWHAHDRHQNLQKSSLFCPHPQNNDPALRPLVWYIASDLSEPDHPVRMRSSNNAVLG